MAMRRWRSHCYSQLRVGLALKGLCLALFVGSLPCTALNAHIGILVPLRDAPGAPLNVGAVRRAASAVMAAHHINNVISSLVPNATSLLPADFQLVFDLQDSMKLPSVAVDRAVHWDQQGIHAIVGSFRSAVTGPLALAASIHATPVISWASTASSLSDTDLYPTLSRTVISDTVLADRTIRSVSSLGWNQVSVVYVNDAWGRGFEKDIAYSASQVGVEIVLSASFALGNRAEMEVAVQRVKKAGAEIVLCPVFDSDLAALAQVADEAGMMKKGYVWIVPSTNNPADVVAASPHPALTQRQLSGWFQGTMDLLAGARLHSFSQVFAAEPLEHLNHTLLGGALTAEMVGGGACDQFCATIHDAVWAAAIAIGRTGPRADGGVDKERMLREIRGVSFEGASGRVRFDASGERDSRAEALQLSNWQPATGPDGSISIAARPVWAWRYGTSGGGVLERVSADPPLWPGGDRGWQRPYEELECGAGSAFSSASLQCEACPPGTDKEGSQCVPYNASVGIVLPLRWAGTGGPMEPWVLRVAAAGVMAVEHVNARSAALVPADVAGRLPRGFKLVFDLQDSLAHPSVAVNHAVAWNAQGRHAVVGSYRSAVTGPLALAAAIEATPVLSWGSTASSLSDTAWYPTLSRTVVSDAELAARTIRTFEAFGWKRIAVLSQDDTWGRGFAVDATKTALAVGVEVAVAATFELSSAASIAEAVAEIKASGAHIILCLALDARDIASVAASADAIGLLDMGYAWVAPAEAMSGEIVMLSPEPEQTQRQLTGWLTTAIDPSFGARGRRFQRALEAERLTDLRQRIMPAEEFEGALHDAVAGDDCSLFCPLIYDAVWTAALAIASVDVGADGSVDKAALLRAVRSQDFEGASGLVRFLPNGDRDATSQPLVVSNIRPADADGLGIALLPTWSWTVGRRSEGVEAVELANISSSAPVWPGGVESWTPPQDGTCGPGALFSIDVLECLPCPRGTRQAGRECKPCEPGTIGADTAVTECSKCQEGYTNRSGMSACSSCPAFSERGPDTLGISVDECFCLANYFRVDVGDGFECRACLEGLVCEGGGKAPYAAEDWWGSGNMTFKCRRPGWCLGRNKCADGHVGAGCGLCTDDLVMDLVGLPSSMPTASLQALIAGGEGWGQSGCTRCVEPEESEARAHLRRFLNYLGVVILGVLVLIIWYYFSWKPLFTANSGDKSNDAKVMGTVFACCTVSLQEMLRSLLARGKELSVLFKILSGFLQVMGSLTSLSVDWPNIQVTVMRWANVLDLDWSVLPGTTCVIGTLSFWHKLLAQTLLPACLLILLGLPTLYVRWAGRQWYGSSKGHPRYAVVSRRFIQSANIIIFLIYPSVSALVLSSFQCSDFGADGRYLTADFRVKCDSSEYKVILWYSVAAVFAYPLGIPAYMLCMMLRHGVARLAREKRHDALFQGLLVLRKRQLSTKVRARLANRFGWTGDTAEFKRRVLGLETLARAPSADGQPAFDPYQDSTRQLEGENLGWRPLRALLAKFIDLPPEEVDKREVKAMLDKYDPDKNGLSTEEMAAMIQDIVDQHCMFTDHEELPKLSVRQLQALRSHDWTLPSDHHEDSLVDQVVGPEDDEDDEDENEERAAGRPGQERLEKRAESGGSDAATGRTRGFARRESCRTGAERRREELITWIRGKAEELDGAGKLPQQPTVWREDGDLEERRAIQRLGFLFLSYRTDAWWFELVMLFYKLLMTSVFGLLFDGSAAQISFAFLTTMFMLVTVLRIRPIVNVKLANLQVLSLFIQALNCFFGLMLSTGTLSGSISPEDPATPRRVNAMSFALVALNAFVLLLPLVQVVADYRSLKLKYRASLNKMGAMSHAKVPTSRERRVSSAADGSLSRPSLRPEDRKASMSVRWRRRSEQMRAAAGPGPASASADHDHEGDPSAVLPSISRNLSSNLRVADPPELHSDRRHGPGGTDRDSDSDHWHAAVGPVPSRGGSGDSELQVEATAQPPRASAERAAADEPGIMTRVGDSETSTGSPGLSLTPARSGGPGAASASASGPGIQVSACAEDPTVVVDVAFAQPEAQPRALDCQWDAQKAQPARL